MAVSKRKKFQIVSVIVLFLLGGFIFYKYFPEIWGDAVYPLAYQDQILTSANEFHLQRNLIAAVIYVESHFNPTAGSGAGARGLMQLMPPTARGVAKQIGITDYTDDKIYDPTINIRLGSAYLRSAIDSRNGNIDVALANYNGGPGVAGNFEIAMDRSTLPRETDRYIRSVKGAWEAYDKIYGTDWQGPTKPFEAPKETSFISQINIKNLLNVFFNK
ncbi:hypothetical protein COS66_01520 [Candidatus Berkelbacteria bacterium CG06_land_8_20_14_3_00_43_10]|nr:MAG: hypothetical protein AUK41_03635 [Candidatus Berkelbacteria bacterium CG2_30_43_20]PIU87333.1 MAG: hypothetical protein COS66_01520 [Candidatus Berkelbacteria bacterium CG06_land_8_20_14_3_00_43_10]